MVKVGERVERTKATTERIGGRKSLKATRAGKANRRNSSRPSLEAHASYAIALIGYATFWKKICSIPSPPNSRATSNASAH